MRPRMQTPTRTISNNMRSDVIAAISTPPGKGGVAIIRISGLGAHEVASRAFRPASGKALTEYPARRAIYGAIINNKGETVDDGLALLFPESSSYTGEEACEISCHGGVLVTRAVLECVLEAGAVIAEAGEFTRRAFINGRISLADAEAIGNLLEAKTEEQLKLFSDSGRSRLNKAVECVSERMTRLLSSVYARIDYPEEDLGELDDGDIERELIGIEGDIDRLISSYKTGRVISEGVTVSLVGRPNAGKSSLYNLLLGEERAIVTDTAGTTRDVLETQTQIGRAVVRLRDTAGVRECEGLDKVESIGIELTRRAIRTSELLIALFDSTSELTDDDFVLLSLLKEADCPVIYILNKCDSNPVLNPSALDIGEAPLLLTSVTSDPEGTRARITSIVEQMLFDGDISPDTEPIVSSARQHASLTKAKKLIGSAIEAHRAGLFSELTASEVELALGAILELNGRAVSEAVVGDIFARFCVGK